MDFHLLHTSLTVKLQQYIHYPALVCAKFELIHQNNCPLKGVAISIGISDISL